MNLVEEIGKYRDTKVRVPQVSNVVQITELKSFLTCRLRWWFTASPPKGLGLTSKVELPELGLGKLIHETLQVGYDSQLAFTDIYEVLAEEVKAGLEPSKIFQDYNKKILEDLELGRVMIAGYQDWARQADRDYHFLSTETQGLVPLEDNLNLFFVFDAIVEREDGLWVMDFKTTGRNYVPWTSQDLQATAYTYAARKYVDPNVKGVIFRFLYKKEPYTYDKLILKSGKLTERKLEGLTTYRNYLEALAILVVKELAEEGSICYEGPGTYESYAQSLQDVQREEVFRTKFALAKQFYYQTIRNLQYDESFYFDVDEYRSDIQVDNYMENVILPAAREMRDILWVGPTGLATAWATCPRCQFKVPCKLYMDGAPGLEALLEEEFKISDRYLEEEDATSD